MTGSRSVRRPNRTPFAPALSVVMPVHNALPYLDAAVQSILGQTFADFEFVILDDASTDGSTHRLREWADRDRRIRLVEVSSNLGPSASSARVASEAKAAIVARMDSDDIAYPTRFEQQLAILNRHPDVGVVGGLVDFIDSSGRKIRDAELWRLYHGGVIPPFGNGPMMYRRSVFEQVGGYREECEYWEDKELILRMAEVAKVMVIPHSIYQIRQSTGSTRVVSDPERLERAVDLAFRCLRRLEQGRGYQDLLAGRGSDGDGKVDPRVFMSLGSVVLWAGVRPRFLGRLLRRGRLSLDIASASALVWTAWATVNPATLRMFLNLLLRIRESSARAGSGGGPVLWSPAGATSLGEQPGGNA